MSTLFFSLQHIFWYFFFLWVYLDIQHFILIVGMETKKIEIQQAMEGEKFNKTLLNFEEFKQELAINKINDIFAHTVKIKQDKTKYIFSTNDKNIFAIEGKTALVNRIQKFYKEKGITEERTAEQQVLIRME